MELKPSIVDIVKRDAYLLEQEIAKSEAAEHEQALIDRAEAKLANESRASHYKSVVTELARLGKPIEYQQFTSKDTECIGAWASEWAPVPSADQNTSLVAECRYLSLALITSWRDKADQKVSMRHTATYIELRWRDASIDYSSEPQKLIRLHDDALVVLDSGKERHLIPSTDSATDQIEFDDVMSTILEPLVHELSANTSLDQQ